MSEKGSDIIEWWAERVQEKLSQGDIVHELPIFQATQPVKHLKKTTYKGNTEGWVEADASVLDSEKKGHFLATGKLGPAIIISHSCELDKGKGRVLVAPIAPILSVLAEQQRLILEQKHYALMPLPDVPELGSSYADFRAIFFLHRSIVESGRRIVSMSEVAVERLSAQIVAFFTRKKMP